MLFICVLLYCYILVYYTAFIKCLYTAQKSYTKDLKSEITSFISQKWYLQTFTSVPLLRISVKLGISTVTLQKYHPLWFVLTFDKMQVFLESCSVLLVKIFSQSEIDLLATNPDLLKNHEIRYRSYFSVFKKQYKARSDPDGTLTVLVSFRNTAVWPDITMAVVATVNRKKKIFYFLNHKIVYVDKNYRQATEFRLQETCTLCLAWHFFYLYNCV